MLLTRKEWKVFKQRNLEICRDRYNFSIQILDKKFLKYMQSKPLLNKILQHFLKLKFELEFILSGKASIPNVDFIITTNCTLKCEQCSSLMHFYNKENSYIDTFESFKQNLDNLLKSVHNVYRLQLIGGEPLLNKDLVKMVEYASKKKQVKAIVTITNGTIVPSDKLIQMYKKYHTKNYIDVSDYRDNPKIKILKTEEVTNSFKNAGLHVYNTNYDWYKRGHIQKENRTPEELEKVMFSCWQYLCTAYCDGELHICSRSVAIKRILDKNLGDYVKMSSDKDSSKEVTKLFCKKYVQACDWCHTECDKKIPRAEQLSECNVCNEG